MRYIKFVVVAVFLLLNSIPVFAEKVAVIVNINNTQTLSRSDLAAIYSDKIVQWNNGNPIMTFDLPVSHEARAIFSEKVLGMSAKDAAKEWANRKITNTAKNPPKTKKERLVVMAVRRNVNALGYVSESAIEGKSDIKVLMTLE